MQHKGISTLAFQRIDYLRITRRTECYRANSLCLATCKQSTTVNLGEYVNLTRDGTHSARITAVNTRFARQNAFAYQTLFNFLEDVLHFVCRRASLHSQRCYCRSTNSTDTLVTNCLLGDTVCFTQINLDLIFNSRH